jgi:hypothetical protein
MVGGQATADDRAVLQAFLAKAAGKPLREVAKESGIAFSTIGRMRRGEPWTWSYAIRLKMRRSLGQLSGAETERLRELDTPRVSQGWQCPACRRVWAPWVESCTRCD